MKKKRETKKKNKTKPPTRQDWEKKYKKLLRQHRGLEKRAAEDQRLAFLFRQFLANVPDTVYFKDLYSRFILVSECMKRHFEVSDTADMLGKTDFDFFGKEHASQAFHDEQNIIRTGEPLLNFEEKEGFSNNMVSWISTSKFPLRSDTGKIVGTFGISRDINDLKFAQESAKAKERFLANMSHEIRTPLNGIMGVIRMLARTSLDVQQREYLNIIHMSSQNLMVILNDILDLTKLHSQKLQLESIGFHFTKTVKSAIRNYEAQALEKNLELTISIDENIPPVLIGDPVRLFQIITNLVSNAIKFTTRGGVAITSRLARQDKANCEVEIEVKDTGIGIKDTKVIFEVFEQENTRIFRKFGGTGLGLAICKELVDLCGGTIKVRSKVNRGTSFIVKLPFKKGTDKDYNDDISIADLDETALAGKKILLAEDNEINQYVIASILREWNMDVTVVPDGAEAIKKAEENHYDLILMDLKMPGVSGLEASEHIRYKLNRSVPILALSANSLPIEIEKTRQAGMTDFVTKPVSPTVLYRKLLDLLHVVEADRWTVSAPATENGAAITFDLSTLHDLARGSDEFIITTLGLFLEKIPAIVHQAKDAWDSGKIDEIRNLAHKMKSSAALFKFEPLSTVIADIENTNNTEQMSKLIDQLDTCTQEACRVLTNELHRIEKRQ